MSTQPTIRQLTRIGKAPAGAFLLFCPAQAADCVVTGLRTKCAQPATVTSGVTMGTSISFKRPDGKDASGYLANAEQGHAPGVVVIQEWWGLQEQIKGICDRFAIA